MKEQGQSGRLFHCFRAEIWYWQGRSLSGFWSCDHIKELTQMMILENLYIDGQTLRSDGDVRFSLSSWKQIPHIR